MTTGIIKLSETDTRKMEFSKMITDWHYHILFCITVQQQQLLTTAIFTITTLAIIDREVVT